MRDRVFKSSVEERGKSPRAHFDEGLRQRGRFMVMMLNDVHLPFNASFGYRMAWQGLQSKMRFYSLCMYYVLERATLGCCLASSLRPYSLHRAKALTIHLIVHRVYHRKGTLVCKILYAFPQKLRLWQSQPELFADMRHASMPMIRYDQTQAGLGIGSESVLTA
jgi:hypothetical protein